MFGTTILGVAIGLVFVYLTLGLVCTAISEAINSLLHLRATTLYDAIGTMLEKPELRDAFYNHPMMRTLRQADDAYPSYIDADVFANVLLDIATEEPGGNYESLEQVHAAIERLPERPRLALRTMLDQKVEDVDEAKLRISGWFNLVMERASGWYKRRIQAFTFVAAAVLTVGLDADSLAIAQATWQDDDLRQELVARASLLDENTGDLPRAVKDRVVQLQRGVDDLKSSGIPLGWTREDLCSTFGTQCVAGIAPDRTTLALNLLAKLFGLLATTFAVSLGAPFWFDILNRLVNIRTATTAARREPEPTS